MLHATTPPVMPSAHLPLRAQLATSEKLLASSRETTALLEAILTSTGDGVVVVDADGRSLAWKPAAHDLLGPPQDDIALHEFPARYGLRRADGDEIDASSFPLAAAMKGQAATDHQVCAGREMLNVTANPLVNDSGDTIGAVLTLRNVTALFERQRIAEEYASELERSNQSLTEFAYVASHDMREPLRIVSAFCELLDSRYSDRLDEDGRQYVAFIGGAVERMRSLVDDLLHLARVRSAPLALRRFPAGEAAWDAVTDLAMGIEETDAEVEIGPLPMVTADRRLLTLVFQNLLANSLKFSTGRPQIKVSADEDGGEVTFSVADQGIGFDAIHAERIFTIFQRLHREEYPGTGMGLAIVAEIVRRHRGRVWAEPGVAGGTTVRFTTATEEAAP
ncbi:MAG TPA: ATP-binding protein [Candidatus Limnocylindrales bacterium]|nr:ATP-binding protein [Candidatus Limnocylindrales bacterium]